jgi:hypothetical protein
VRLKLREIPGAVGHYTVGSLLVLYRLVRIGVDLHREPAARPQ